MPSTTTVCAYCGQDEGHSPRCSVARHGVEELRISKCPTCGSCVKVVSTDEGTNHYAPYVRSYWNGTP